MEVNCFLHRLSAKKIILVMYNEKHIRVKLNIINDKLSCLNKLGDTGHENIFLLD